MRVAKKAVFAGGNVAGTTRDPAKKATLTELGIQAVIADWTDRATLCSLPPAEQILISVSYDRQSDQSRLESQVGGLRNLLEVISPEAHVVYISTTGVYHQSDGQWVDEDSPANPTREGGQTHRRAEQLLEQLRPGARNTVLRLAGIYGPKRVPRVSDVVAGRPIASSQNGYLNLIHVDDAADVVMAAWSQSRRNLYVVCDDHPVVRGEFYREVARQADVSEPRFVAPSEDASPRGRSDSNKRVRNRRMKEDLVSPLRFPSYREGLSHVLSKPT